MGKISLGQCFHYLYLTNESRWLITKNQVIISRTCPPAALSEFSVNSFFETYYNKGKFSGKAISQHLLGDKNIASSLSLLNQFWSYYTFVIETVYIWQVFCWLYDLQVAFTMIQIILILHLRVLGHSDIRKTPRHESQIVKYSMNGQVK